MIDWVDGWLNEWGEWRQRDTFDTGTGWPRQSVVYRMMRMNSRGNRRRKRTKAASKPFRRQVEMPNGKTKSEAVKPMVPVSQPKQTGYNNWDNSFLWPPHIERIDQAVERLPEDYQQVIRIRYLSYGSTKDKLERTGMAERTYYDRLGGAHRILAIALA